VASNREINKRGKEVKVVIANMANFLSIFQPNQVPAICLFCHCSNLSSVCKNLSTSKLKISFTVLTIFSTAESQ
jgi:hypothetical protein